MVDLIGYVYILLFPNGKRYVGQTIQSIEKRMASHMSDTRNGSSFPVHNALRKYGESGINLGHIPVYGEQEDLDSAEDRCIVHYDTLVPNGYNLQRGGAHGVPSEETRRKMSKAKQGRPGAMKGRHLSEEHKAKISAAKRGTKHSEETKSKISDTLKGHSGYWTGKCRSSETRAKISAGHRGKPKSEEHKAKISSTLKKRYEGEH